MLCVCRRCRRSPPRPPRPSALQQAPDAPIHGHPGSPAATMLLIRLHSMGSLSLIVGLLCCRADKHTTTSVSAAGDGCNADMTCRAQTLDRCHQNTLCCAHECRTALQRPSRTRERCSQAHSLAARGAGQRPGRRCWGAWPGRPAPTSCCRARAGSHAVPWSCRRWPARGTRACGKHRCKRRPRLWRRQASRTAPRANPASPTPARTRGSAGAPRGRTWVRRREATERASQHSTLCANPGFPNRLR